MPSNNVMKERRELILMCAKEGKTAKAIATELGLKAKSVQNTLYNARKTGALDKADRFFPRAKQAPVENVRIRPPVFARAESAKIVTCPHCHQTIVVE